MNSIDGSELMSLFNLKLILYSLIFQIDFDFEKLYNIPNEAPVSLNCLSKWPQRRIQIIRYCRSLCLPPTTAKQNKKIKKDNNILELRNLIEANQNFQN